MTAALIMAIIAATLVFDIAFFIFLARFLVKKSGMAALARRYPAYYRPGGTQRLLTVAMIGGVRFKRSVSIIPSDEGLYLKLTGFFQRVTRPKPAVIPWDQIRIAERQKVNRMEAVELTIGEPETGSLSLLQDDFMALEPFIKRAETPF
jgi:hypothetical protein